MIKKLILVVSYVFLLSACVVTRSDLRTSEERQLLQEQIQKQQVTTEERLTEMENTLRGLVGDIEELKNAKNLMNQADEMGEKKIQESFNIVQDRMNTFKEALVGQEKLIKELVKKIEDLDKQLKKKSKVKAEKVPKGNYASGEYWFAKKEWKKAAKGYQEYRELNPNGRRYVESTFKIGVCFENLGLKKEAKAFYQEVVSKAPGSELAKRANKQLKTL